MSRTRVDRPPVTERRVAREHRRGPDPEPEDEQVVADRVGQPLTADGEVVDRPPRPRRPSPGTTAARSPLAARHDEPTSSGTIRAAKTPPTRCVVQRPQPTAGPRTAEERAADRRPRAGSRCTRRRPRTSRASSSDQASDRQISDDEADASASRRRGDGASRRASRVDRSGHGVLSSGQDLAERPPGVISKALQLVLGQRVAQRARALGASAASRRSRQRGTGRPRWRRRA